MSRHRMLLSPSRSPVLARSASLRSQGGFVLVAILMLIALSLVLIVTTSSISQMERKAVSNSTKEEIAKRNALFALEVALAQLQKEAGPDQRVTATADIYNTNATNPSVSQPYWTGVWKTFNPAWTNDSARQPWYRPQPLDVKMSGQSTPILRDWSTNATNVVWLVSGASDNLTINPFSFGSNAATSGGNSVVVATGWGTNGDSISVPLVTINAPGAKVSATNPVPGRYAYWISDEGVKAKVTLVETNLTKKPITSSGMLVSSLVHYLGAAPPYLPSVMTNYGGVTNTVDIRTNASLPLITSLNGLSYADPSYAGITNNAMAADFTVWSYGVICDVRRGGLKQDLTAAMESTVSNSKGFDSLIYRSGSQLGGKNNNDQLMAYSASAHGLPVDISSSIKSVNQGVTGTYIDGLRWQSLYNYYNLYKTRMQTSPICSSSSSSPFGVGVLAMNSNNTIQSRVPAWNDPSGANINYGSMTPTIIADSIIAKLVSVKIGTTNYFQVQYYPYVIMHNPYSTALDVSGSTFTITKSISSVNGGVQVTLGSKDSKTGTQYTNNDNRAGTNLWPISPTTNLNSVFQPRTTSEYPFTLKVTNSPGTIFGPGEIRVYSLQGSNIIVPSLQTNLAGFSIFTNPISSSGVPLVLSSSSSNTISDGYGGIGITLTNWNGTTNPSDTVSFNLGGRLGISYNVAHFTSAGITSWPNSSVANDIFGVLPGTGGTTNSYSTTPSNSTFFNLYSYPIIVLSVTERFKGTIRATSYTNYIGTNVDVPIFMGNSVYFNADKSWAGQLAGYNPAIETDVNLQNLKNIEMFPSAVNSNTTVASWLFQPVGDATPIVIKQTNNNVAIVFRGIPLTPMLSLGQFMHFDEYYTQGSTGIFPVTIPGMSIGGSLCSPETGPNITSLIFNGNSTGTAQWHLMMDNSFLANEALFDTYFFSTVPPTNGFSWGTGVSGIGVFNYKINATNIATNQSLPNPRFLYYRKNGVDPTPADLQDESKASANLLTDGPFNVNSTSVSAWKALLTSLNGQTFPIYNYISGEFEQRLVTNPILRFWDVGRFNPNDPWDGMRSLSDKQVTTLAKEIVKQVKLRGPFLSFSDFLNRRLSSNNVSYSTNNLMGCLQSAIENTQTNGSAYDVNSNIHISSVSTSISSVTLSNGASITYNSPPLAASSQIPLNKIVTNSAVGIPGYLMQQDIVQAFAPVMTVRSDTFMIRVYGEANRKIVSSTKSPGVEARAWGEAVVQRVPDFVDQTDPALTKPNVINGISSPLGDATPIYGSAGSIVSTLNESLGRRFRVVSFRWLNQTDL